MGYTRLTAYGSRCDVAIYEKEPPVGGRGGKRNRFSEASSAVSSIPFDGQDAENADKQAKVRAKANASRVKMAFSRLCASNLGGGDHPVLASLTYAENMEDVTRGRSDFAAFGRSIRKTFGAHVRYISVLEFQRRGAVHFHALIWGLPADVVARERSARVVAKIWGRGFADLKVTDGSEKLAGYLGKYLSKSMSDSRLFGLKAYVASRNVKRPLVDKFALLGPYFAGLVPGCDLSTAILLTSDEKETHWMGRAIYKRYFIGNSYAESNA